MTIGYTNHCHDARSRSIQTGRSNGGSYDFAQDDRKAKK